LSLAARHHGGPSGASTPASSRGWPDQLAYTTSVGRFIAKHPLSGEVITRKTRRIMVITDYVHRWEIIAGRESIMWAQVPIMWAGRRRENQSMWRQEGCSMASRSRFYASCNRQRTLAIHEPGLVYPCSQISPQSVWDRLIGTYSSLA
jgi:hypothetical protein